MSVNFYKHHDELVSAYRECLDPKCNTNWAMFGYDKQTNDLMLLDKGDGGLSELAGEFNPARIQYAFCEAKDGQTNVSRFLLINWQGESAPMQRKGVCMNHFRDVQQFFKGAHVVLQASTEEEVESDVLMAHVMKMSNRIKIDKASENATKGSDDQPKPVGTNYQRVNANSEISKTDRETFWEKQKKEDEAQRKAERQREAETRASRTTVNSDGASSPAGRSAEKPIVPNKSTELRQARMDEAKQLIGKRSISNVKAIFENANSTPKTTQARKQPIKIDRDPAPEPQTSSDKTVKPESMSDVETSKAAADNTETSVPESKTISIDQTIKSDVIPKSDLIPASVPTAIEFVNGNAHLNSHQNGLTKVPEEEEEEVDDVAERDYEDSEIIINNDDGSSGEDMCPPSVDYLGELARNSYYETYRPLENIQEENEDDGEDHGLRAKALYDYQAAEEGEITFDPDDIITHIDQIDSGWWQGLAPNGVYGLFPANYVELLPN